MLEAERIIVNKEFIENSNTLNCCVGGSRPPTRKGPANGNYGNKWSLEKRKELSNFFKKNRDTKGGNNNRAIPVLCINLITERKYEFECMKDAGLFLNLKPDTIRKYRNEIGHIFKEFWIVIEKDRRDIDLKSLMIERITQLSVPSQFFRRWFWKQDDKDLQKLTTGGKWYRDQYKENYKKLFENEDYKN